jgi:hypothetical protein
LKKSEEGSPLEYAAEPGLIHTRVSDVRPQSIVSEAIAQAARENETVAIGHVPAPPDARVESGLVWPPVDGRAVLHEIAKAHIQLSCSEQGDWSGMAQERWKVFSAAAEVFDDINAGRMMLVEAARSHATSNRSQERCVALANDGQGRWRLWQITRLGTAQAGAEPVPAVVSA